MRLVAVADTHLFHDELSVPDGDVFVHTGDLCRAGTLDELKLAAQWLRRLPHKHKVVIAGNHDWAFDREPTAAREVLGEDVTWLHDSGATIAGLSFWGSPWQPAYNDWAFNLPRGEALAAKWALIPKGVEVLVTHGPPAGVGDGGGEGYGGRDRLGCAELRGRVEVLAPRVHLFGHIHDAGGAWQHGPTLFANVTTWECERPATVLDLEATTVRVVSAPPARR